MIYRVNQNFSVLNLQTTSPPRRLTDLNPAEVGRFDVMGEGRIVFDRLRREIGIGAAVTRRPLPHHRAYGSVHGGSSRLR
jgi:hypothetical protein